MELEKQNEIVWSVKRKGHPGRFEFRATEQGSTISKVAVGLEQEGNKIMFSMNVSEFNNFYGIISNFKDLIEGKPDNSPVSEKRMHSIRVPPNQPIAPLSLDGMSTLRTKKEEFKDLEPSLEEIDMGLASLDDLDNPEDEFEEIQMPIVEEKKPKALEKPAIPNKSTNQNSPEKKLKETDWDPW